MQRCVFPLSRRTDCGRGGRRHGCDSAWRLGARRGSHRRRRPTERGDGLHRRPAFQALGGARLKSEIRNPKARRKSEKSGVVESSDFGASVFGFPSGLRPSGLRISDAFFPSTLAPRPSTLPSWLLRFAPIAARKCRATPKPVPNAVRTSGRVGRRRRARGIWTSRTRSSITRVSLNGSSAGSRPDREASVGSGGWWRSAWWGRCWCSSCGF